MATQRAVEGHLKAWQEATELQAAIRAARAAAAEFDGLYAESARNLLARTPELMLLLSAYQAGRMSAEPGARLGGTLGDAQQGDLLDG